MPQDLASIPEPQRGRLVRYLDCLGRWSRKINLTGAETRDTAFATLVAPVLGAEALFVGSGIFKSEDPKDRAKAIVTACTYYDRPEVLAEISTGLGQPMQSIDIRELEETQLLAARGW